MTRMLLTVALVAAGAVVWAQNAVNLPGLVVHTNRDPRIEATGHIACTNDILEFVAVQREGREYESLIALDCKPSVFQAALLLIGSETGAVQQATANAPTGTRLRLDVQWQQGKGTKHMPVEALLYDRQAKKAPTDLLWTFNGSYFTTNPVTGRRVFLADEERAHIALWYQSGIPVNVGGNFGNPYQNASHGFEANPATTPPKGTPVTLIIRKREK